MFNIQGLLGARAPFSWELTLAHLRRHPAFRDEYVIADSTVYFAHRLPSQLVTIALSNVQASEETLLNYTFWSKHPLTDKEKAQTVQYCCFLFGLNDQLTPFYQLADSDPIFHTIRDNLYGFHHIRYASAFSAACWAIMATRNNVPHKTHDLIANFGDVVTLPGRAEQVALFPEPSTIAALTEDQLIAAIGPAQRSRRPGYLLHAASAFASVDPDFLQQASSKEIERWLLAIRGIGPWGAMFVLQRGLGRMELLPVAEPKVSKDAAHFYNAGTPLSKEALIQLAARYASYQGYWSHYLRAFRLLTSE